jgi:MoaA/NifB/PqqE/SkfB family radical SAM enzyme
MFKYSQIESVHIEITTNCQAKCPMCIRNRKSGLENPNLKLTDMSFENFKKGLSINFIKQLKSISFCGNYGDPIINNDLMDIIQYLTKTNPNIRCIIHTNGSARSIEWWKAIANALPQNHIIYFALDGLEDTHHLYRVGTHYNKIIENSKAFIEAGGIAAWVFIKFKHNQHQLEKARELAIEYGFKEFHEKETARFISKPSFDVLDKDGNIIYELEMPDNSKLTYVTEDSIRRYTEIFNEPYIVNCKSEELKEIFIDAEFNIWPCCFLGSLKMIYTPDSEIYIDIRKRQIDEYNNLLHLFGGIKNINALHSTIEKIIDNDIWQSIWDEEWYSRKNFTCIKTCSKIQKFKISTSFDQLLERQKLNDK